MADYVLKVTLPYTLDPDPFNSSKPRESLVEFGKVLGRLATGSYPGDGSAVSDSEADTATGTVTFASLAADDKVQVGNVEFTAKVTASTSTQFALGASDTAAAANLAAKVNAHASLTGVVTADSADEVVTFTSEQPGPIGNGLQLSSTNNTRAAVVAFSGGAATRTTFSY